MSRNTLASASEIVPSELLEAVRKAAMTDEQVHVAMLDAVMTERRRCAYLLLGSAAAFRASGETMSAGVANLCAMLVLQEDAK